MEINIRHLSEILEFSVLKTSKAGPRSISQKEKSCGIGSESKFYFRAVSRRWWWGEQEIRQI